MSTAEDRTALVVGGSLAGLSAAFYLERAGLRVDVMERSPVAMRGQGAGIVLNPATIRHLDGDRGALDRLSVPTRWLRYLDGRGAIIAETASALRFASYDALYRSFLDRLNRVAYHLDREVTGARQTADGVVVQLASGAEHQADLMVWADGIRSIGRRRLAPEAERAYAGYVAWRGTVSPQRLGDAVNAVLSDAITYYVGRGTHLLAYPIKGGDGEQLINWLWYRNVPAESLRDLLTTDDGAVGEVSVPPGRVAAPVLDELRVASRTLPAPMAALLEATDRPFPQAVFDLAVAKMAFGRECLVGDAAFVLRPHAAAGAAKAAEDGYRLGSSIASGGDLASALAAWEQPQLELGRTLVERNRVAGERLQFANTWRAGEPLPFGLHRQGDSDMAAHQLPEASVEQAAAGGDL